MAKKTSKSPTPQQHTPAPRVYIEKINDTEYRLEERALHIFDEVSLWNDNPRLLPYVRGDGFSSEEELEDALRRTKGYANLAKSIATVGQMEAIYVWKSDPQDESQKYLVLEGATRVTILREQHRAKKEKDKARPTVRAKVLPPDFGDLDRVVLLAKIHVRRDSVRSWGRYIEAKFIHDHVSLDGKDRLMSATHMAKQLGKSTSWVTRLWHAYDFARRFIEHVDASDAETMAIEHFSTLEEISKAPQIGTKVRSYDNPEHDELRAEVFDMVKKEVFKEYRDARFMKEFHDDPDKWAQLKSGTKHIAHQLASEVKVSSSSLKGRISGLEAQLERAISRDEHAIDEQDVEQLQRALTIAENCLHPDVNPFRRQIIYFVRAIEDASLNDFSSVEDAELKRLTDAYDYFQQQITRARDITRARARLKE